MQLIVDKIRRELSPKLNKDTRSRYGQYFTPISIATYMASRFDVPDQTPVRILDAGAGLGSLSLALCENFRKNGFDLSAIEITAYEVDDGLAERLNEMLGCQSITNKFHFEVRNVDFIHEAVSNIRFRSGPRFTHAILNPPYKKMATDSSHRRWLSTVGIETVNLYSAFVALAILLLEPKGELVAILPRSFCNGPYYKPFRNFILRETAIRSIHLFHSRDKAFSDDSVLQENVIVHLKKGVDQEELTISTSSDDSFADLTERKVKFDEIVFSDDEDVFFHIPSSDAPSFFETNADFSFPIESLGISVSTGPVVDFRSRDYVSKVLEAGGVPLLYPGHFVGDLIDWPKSDWKRANAIERNALTQKWLFPMGFYVAIRRFSSKEEKRRINAGVVNPSAFQGFDWIGFENRLNILHAKRRGLDEYVAYGLAAFLNSSPVDDYFRRFNGHTQVNATDLRALRYPKIEVLRSLGRLAKEQGYADQITVDNLIASLPNFYAR